MIQMIETNLRTFRSTFYISLSLASFLDPTVYFAAYKNLSKQFLPTIPR